MRRNDEKSVKVSVEDPLMVLQFVLLEAALLGNNLLPKVWVAEMPENIGISAITEESYESNNVGG